MKRVVITGASGLLGGRLAEHLKRSPTTEVIQTSREARHGFLQLDICNDDEVSFVFKGADWVIHTAGMNAADCANAHDRAHEINGVRAGRLAEIAADLEVQGFILLSTVHVYGAPLVGNLTEASPLLNGHPYAASNKLGEQLVAKALSNSDTAHIILRLSNCFGAPVDLRSDCWTLVLNDVAKQIATQGFVNLNSSGQQLRDFLPIQYFCETVDGLMETCAEGVFNMASGNARPILDPILKLKKIAEEDLGKSIQLDRKPNRSNAEHQLTIDIDAIKRLGFKAPSAGQFELELKALWEFCRLNFMQKL